MEPDWQGWASESPCFSDLIAELRPSLVIEVDSWKGASLLKLAQASERLGLGSTFICIDTWLGYNVELWLHATTRASLKLQGGYPTIFRTFLRNLCDANLLQRVFPMPMTLLTAAMILRHRRLQADLSSIDAVHTQCAVETDLEAFSQLLRPGGVLLGDDYLPEWFGVIAAAQSFGRRHGLALEQRQEKFLFRLSI
ncbi:MAG: class I SAM-dependent methyltransferase [Cyanobacteria bacterium]|nr:class I SAM-dependent methyltransferase [Cyanobacteriota bacterium]